VATQGDRDTVDATEPKTIQVRTLLIWGLVVLLFVLWIGWWQWDRFVDRVCAPLIDAARSAPVETGTIEETVEPEESVAPDLAAATASWEAFTGASPDWPADFASPRDCAAVDRDLNEICRTLDERPYVAERLQSGSTCGLIRQVSESLATHPPTLASELKSHEAMLSNVFHLFRTIGPRKLSLLHEISSEEAANQEAIALALYRWLASRERCATDNGTQIRLDRLYDYAGFVTQTMGGQAYLRRRSPSTEALATFYALVVLDAAVAEDINPQGIDPRPDLQRCRTLIAEQPFVFRDRYLDVLDGMIARWNARTVE
jgi:hypothetical protein